MGPLQLSLLPLAQTSSYTTDHEPHSISMAYTQQQTMGVIQ